MSVAIAHFAIGATISLILFRLGSKTENYIQFDIIVAIVGGLWAMIPDIPELFNMMGHVFQGPLSDIFFFHYTLDKADILDSVTIPSLLIMLLILIVLVITPNIKLQE